MQNINISRKKLSTAEVTSRREHKLHRVKLFAPAICRVVQGSKIIVQGETSSQATSQELIILPADFCFEIINQPSNGLFRSEILYLPVGLLTEFKAKYMTAPSSGRLTSLCVPLNKDLTFGWENVLNSIYLNTSIELQYHQVIGLLLTLYKMGFAGPLFFERTHKLTEQVRQIIMFDPANNWSVQKIANQLFVGESTLRRRLQQESQSFRQIVEEVRMSHALSQLQTTTLPIAEIARQSGYLSGSRFTARFSQYYGILPKNIL